MVECKLVKLSTDFTPERIALAIELVPANGNAFDIPMEEAGKKLSEVCNYAVTTFGVRYQTLPKAPIQPGAQDPDERRIERTEAGKKRALSVLEAELERAKATKDPKQIAQAQANLERGRTFANARAP